MEYKIGDAVELNSGLGPSAVVTEVIQQADGETVLVVAFKVHASTVRPAGKSNFQTSVKM